MQQEFPMNLNPEDIYACGRVAVWSSMLDTTMEVAIWSLLNLPKPSARKLTHGMNANRKREWLAILSSAPSLTSAQKEDLSNIVEQIKGILGDRNCVIHGLWHIGPDGTTWAAKFNEKGRLTFHHLLDKSLIQPIADQTKLAARHLAQWINARDPMALASAFPKIDARTKSVGQIQCHQSPKSVKSTKTGKRKRPPRSSRA